MTINEINNEIEKLKDSNIVYKDCLLLDYRRIVDNKIFIDTTIGNVRSNENKILSKCIKSSLEKRLSNAKITETINQYNRFEFIVSI